METEDHAFKILTALEVESLRESNKLQRKTLNEICGEIFENSEENRAKATAAIRYLWQHRLIEGAGQGTEMRIWPSPEGFDLLLQNRAANKAAIQAANANEIARNKWTLDRRLVVLGIIVAVVAIVANFLH